jgi:hypothetical protein
MVRRSTRFLLGRLDLLKGWHPLDALERAWGRIGKKAGRDLHREGW